MIFRRAQWLRLGWDTSFKKSSVEIKKPVLDSRKVSKGSAFFAYDGTHVSGKDFLFEALEKGASAVFVDIRHKKEILEDDRFSSNLPIFFGLHFRKIAGQTISFLLGDPSKSLEVIGITGTNGKTTTALFLQQTLEKLKQKTAYIGTLGFSLGREKKDLGLTTPDVISVHQLLEKSLKKKAVYAILEASSHGLWQGRLEGVEFNLGIFTNLTQDHLDYHEDMESYYEAKKILFLRLLEIARKYPKAVYGAIIGTDTSYGKRLAKEIKSLSPPFPVITVGEEGDAKLTQIRPSWNGYRALLIWAQKTYKLKTSLLGRFNLENFAFAFLALLLLGFEADEILPYMQKLSAPEGRMEVIKGPQGRHIVIDYAHTPDALQNLLETVAELNPIRIILVFGCGGNRDKGKRPLMGRIANRMADFTIITNDNPRNEDPQSIVNDIKQEMKGSNFIVVFERDKAIHTGLTLLGPQEVLVIAGKGHENYQILKDKTIHFSDKEVATKLLASMKYDNK